MARRGWRTAMAAMALGMGMLVGGTARATLLVPMSDEDLVRTSDLIAVGTVSGIESALLAGGRVVTRVTVAVEQILKGEPAADTVVVTEMGGVVGGRMVVLFGAPEYAAGERVLVFLRRHADGTLRTNALALGKYQVAATPVVLARRTVPRLDERPLDAFAARIVALASGAGVRSDGRAGDAVAPAELVTAVDAFTFSEAAGIPSRWFEADCGLPIDYSRANADDASGEDASRLAIEGAAAAWTDPPDGSLVLGVGAPTTPAPSLIGGTFDGRNTVQFNDPFGEVEDLVSCTGVLARGGFVASGDPNFRELRRTVGGVTFGRIFEGDVTFNDGLGACFAEPAFLAEVATHEIGHAIGFGHSSENPGESDPVLNDATMYFRAHNDGRGASLRQDDLAGLMAGYPTSIAAATPLASAACIADLGILATACFGRSLSTAPFTRFEKARLAVGRAANTTVVKKQKKQLKKALAFLLKADKAITKNVTGECGDAMHARVARLRDAVTAVRAAL